MKKLLITLTLLTFLVFPCLADEGDTGKPAHELFGLVMHPYAGLTMSRLTTAEWTTGFVGGLEIDAGGGLFLSAQYEMHDVLTEDANEVIPWDGTFKLTLGGYF